MQALFTRRDYLRLPDDLPVQLIEGLLVKEATPIYGHQRWADRVHADLLSSVPPDRVLSGPVEVSIDDYNSYHPDVAVYGQAPPNGERGSLLPLVVFEVLSPSTERFDRGVKRRNYLRVGVLEVWLVDGASMTIERHDGNGAASASGDETLASTAIPGFSLRPSRLFAPPR